MPSESAMRAAKRIKELFSNRFDDAFGADDAESCYIHPVGTTPEEIATIIDQETTSNWISCSERMPTEADADRWGNILWGALWEESPIPSHTITAFWNRNFKIAYRGDGYSHWHTLPEPPEKENEQSKTKQSGIHP